MVEALYIDHMHDYFLEQKGPSELAELDGTERSTSTPGEAVNYQHAVIVWACSAGVHYSIAVGQLGPLLVSVSWST